MQVSKTDVVCGVPAPTARMLMRAYYDQRTVEAACGVLGLGPGDAMEKLRAFEAEGYVERAGPADDGGWWIVTIKGSALAQARFGKPITRATAQRLLTGVVGRARNYNSDPRYLLTVRRIQVFGSYLVPGASRLGDLDLTVSIVRREADGERYVQRVYDYARDSGRHFAALQELLFWPERELLMMLKNRSTAISITDEDVSKITDRFQLAYDVSDDPAALPWVAGRGPLA
jgi:hypothetical protein